MSAVESAFTVSKRIGGSAHLPQIFISTDMQVPDHFQIKIKNLIKISALRSGFCQDHRKVKAYRTYIKASYKYRNILFVCRIHSASFVPGA